MASIQQDPSGNYHVCFRFRDSRFKRSLKTNIKRKAEAAASRVEENLRLVDEGRIELPDGVDIPVFLLSDGKLADKPRQSKTIKLGSLFDEYLNAISVVIKQGQPPMRCFLWPGCSSESTDGSLATNNLVGIRRACRVDN